MTECRNCKSKKLVKIVKIGDQPISSIFYKQKKFNLKKYNLDLYKCAKCNLVQLLRNAPLNQMYGYTYGYKSSISNLMVQHLKKKFLNLRKKFNKNKLILDIGSNDGTFLNFFSKKNLLIGIDPSAEKFKKLYNKKIHIISDFFSKKKIYNHLKKRNTKFDLITSFAIFYDIKNPKKFCNDIFCLLKKNGVWVVEFSYLPLMLKNLTFDQICHEHITYYSLTVFNSIINQCALKIVDIQFNEINGGSIEVKCARIDSPLKECKTKLNKIMHDEEKVNSNSFKRFNKRIYKSMNKLKKFLLKNKDHTIGYGASTKGNIVLNFIKIDDKILKFICDSNTEKVNHYTPGTNIKIQPKNQIEVFKPKYIWVIIWPFRKEVIKEQLRFIKNGGKLVFHLPKFHIVNKNNYKKYYFNKFEKLSYNY